MKKCLRCEKVKPLNDFYGTGRKNGYTSRCKNCHGLGERTCIICGGKFEAKANNKLCSDECRKKHRPQTFKVCEHCKVNFGPVDHLKTRFCSNKCKVEYFQSENHPRWDGGKSRETQRARAKVAYKEWRDSVFARDNYTCQDCGKRSKAGDRFEINAHHIKGFAEHRDLRYELSNGETLCVECHRKVHFY